MVALDSRSLTYLDCFGQRFSTSGTVRYAITGPLAACLRLDDPPFLVEVEEQQAAEPQQHDIEVRFKDGVFSAEPPRLGISAGDVVVWHATAAAIPAYAVWGEGEDGGFSSGSMQAEAFYSHAFGSPGEVEWTDANEHGARGVVRVRDLDGSDRGACERWGKVLREGAVVVVEGDRAEPAELDIVTGQTVFFAVTRSGGMTITDATLTQHPA